MYQLIIKSGAYQMLDEAYHWYELQVPGLGERLLDEIGTSFDKLKLTPLFYSYVQENYRQLLVNRFPYKIIFEVIGNDVVIYAIFHTSQNSEK